jgi:hypothetical protein
MPPMLICDFAAAARVTLLSSGTPSQGQQACCCVQQPQPADCSTLWLIPPGTW